MWIRNFSLRGVGVGIIAAIALAGCETQRDSTPGATALFPVATPHMVQSTPYVIDPPDDIVVHAPKIKEIDAAKQTVRTDGYISLNLLGDIKVAGLTTDEVTKKLKEKAALYYIEPDIKIEVTAKSKFYYVIGTASNVPGKKPYTGHDTVISALAEAGFNKDAWPQQVLLSRPAANGHDKATMVINFKKVAEYGDTAQDYVINENDIINVRTSPLTKLNDDLTKLLGPITGAGTVAGTASTVTPAAHP